MLSQRCICLLLLFGLGLPLSASAQQPAKTSPSGVDNGFVQKEFGATCTLVAGPPVFTVDLDGDGVDDIVIVAHCTNPMIDEAENNYKVVDPYNTFYGYGNPKVTSGFGSEDPMEKAMAVLIIHGAGPEAWRAETPKAKFIIINLPFKQLVVKKLTVHKKTIMAIYAEEAHEGAGTVSTVFWDGKKYKYQPVGSTME
jgi:hypothetical protein